MHLAGGVDRGGCPVAVDERCGRQDDERTRDFEKLKPTMGYRWVSLENRGVSIQLKRLPVHSPLTEAWPFAAVYGADAGTADVGEDQPAHTGSTGRL